MVEKIELPRDEKIEKAKEALKASFWGDFLFGGLVVSGLFIFIESLDLPSSVNSSIGISLLISALFLIFLRLLYLRINPYQIETVIKKAGNYYSEGKYERSLELLNKLLEDKRNLRIKEIWYNKAKSLYYLARYVEALRSSNNALEIDPFYKFALLSKGAALVKLKRLEEALECIEKHLSIDQNDYKAWTNKGATLYHLERYQEALECYEKSLAIDQNNKLTLNNKGVTLYHLERYQEALECYEKSLAIDQNYIDAWIGKGFTLEKLERYQEALECYEKSFAIDQNYTEAWIDKSAWYKKACIESLQNNKDKAIEHLKKAINLDDKCKEKAKQDSDFNNIRDSQEFKELIEG